MPRFIVDQKLYGWDGPERQLKRTGNALALLAAGNLLLSVLLGVIPTGVTRHNWVSFAATLALLALLAELIAAVRGASVVIADPLYRVVLRESDKARFVPFPHEAYSGRIFRPTIPVFCGADFSVEGLLSAV